MAIKRYKMIDLFAGAGGLSCGLELAGFTPVLANELVEIYANTYRLNHPDTHVVVGDIRDIEEGYFSRLKEKFGEIDLIAGGPPCQGFSINAPIRSLDDPRNHLFKEYLRVVSEIRPRAVIIENVPGIIQLGGGTVVEQIYHALQDLGYSVEHRILFAGHYGVPQMRFRTIFIAMRDWKERIDFPQPEYYSIAKANFYGSHKYCFELTPLERYILKPQTTIRDAIGDLPPLQDGGGIESAVEYEISSFCSFQEYVRAGASGVTNHRCSRLSAVNKERLKYIGQGENWTKIPFELLPKGMQKARRSDHTKRYGRLDMDSIASTILTKCDPHWGCFFHPTQERTISVREAARIQSFPDKYQFTGSLTQQYEQVGNAVPPLLAFAVGTSVISMLNGGGIA